MGGTEARAGVWNLWSCPARPSLAVAFGTSHLTTPPDFSLLVCEMRIKFQALLAWQQAAAQSGTQYLLNERINE